MGLTEANQILTLNNLRHNVTLRTDGGLKTGRDVVIAAMMGAEEYSLGTSSLVAMGCIMVRQCHSNMSSRRMQPRSFIKRKIYWYTRKSCKFI